MERLTKKQIDLEILKNLNELNKNSITKKELNKELTKNEIKNKIILIIWVLGLIILFFGLSIHFNWNNYIFIGIIICVIGLMATIDN